MADIFDEIDEDLKRDQMQLLWARYGNLVMAAVATIVLLVGLRQGYTAWQTSQAEASASAYQQALKSDDVVGALEAHLGQLSDGYGMLAQFQIAAAQAPMMILRRQRQATSNWRQMSLWSRFISRWRHYYR